MQLFCCKVTLNKQNFDDGLLCKGDDRSLVSMANIDYLDISTILLSCTPSSALVTGSKISITLDMFIPFLMCSFQLI